MNNFAGHASVSCDATSENGTPPSIRPLLLLSQAAAAVVGAARRRDAAAAAAAHPAFTLIAVVIFCFSWDSILPNALVVVARAQLRLSEPAPLPAPLPPPPPPPPRRNNRGCGGRAVVVVVVGIIIVVIVDARRGVRHVVFDVRCSSDAFVPVTWVPA